MSAAQLAAIVGVVFVLGVAACILLACYLIGSADR